MHKKRKWFLLAELLISVVLAAVLITGCSCSGEKKEEQKEEQPAQTEGQDDQTSDYDDDDDDDEDDPLETASSEDPEDDDDDDETEAAPTQDDDDDDDPSSDGNMTASYKEAREVYHDMTGIWIPAASGFEAYYEKKDDYTLVVNTRGNKKLYQDTVAVLTKELGDPVYVNDKDDGDKMIDTSWSVKVEGGTAYFDVVFDESRHKEPWVYLNYKVKFD